MLEDLLQLVNILARAFFILMVVLIILMVISLIYSYLFPSRFKKYGIADIHYYKEILLNKPYKDLTDSGRETFSFYYEEDEVQKSAEITVVWELIKKSTNDENIELKAYVMIDGTNHKVKGLRIYLKDRNHLNEVKQIIEKKKQKKYYEKWFPYKTLMPPDMFYSIYKVHKPNT